MEWDDFRVVLALSRARGLGGAAAALGVDASTVFRRLAALEKTLGARLFERGGGYAPTAAGERLAGAAERMESEAQAADREVTGRDTRLSGSLRVTAADTIAFFLLPPHLAAFRGRHPGIVVELDVGNRVLSLAQREADVALRAMRPAQGDLFGRKLADIAWTVYASRDCLAAHGPARRASDLGRFPIIGGLDDLAPVKAYAWLRRVTPPSAVVYRANSVLQQWRAAAAGIGAALLPCFVGDSAPELERVLPPPPELKRELWLVTHGDLRQTARVRAFMDDVGAGLAAEREALEGRVARTPRRRSARSTPTGRGS
jgi:DNA-binding transcriptional LysR family regulator